MEQAIRFGRRCFTEVELGVGDRFDSRKQNRHVLRPAAGEHAVDGYRLNRHSAELRLKDPDYLVAVAIDE